MKSKLLITITLLTVMVSMTGIAAADQINVYEPGTTTVVKTIQLQPGGVGDIKDLNISGLLQGSGTPHTLTTQEAVTVNPGGAASSSDIIITYQSPQGSGPWGSGPYGWTQTAGAGGYQVSNVQFKAAANAPPGATYQIQITDSATNNAFTVSVLIQSTTIPEFPTVALPVGAAIGLVLFFQHKKRKEE